MNLNKGCIEIWLLPGCRLKRSKMNLNKGCIEIVVSEVAKDIVP